jgi:hypothetical protein
MQLKSIIHPAIGQLSGSDSGIIVTAGQRIKIETSPDGIEILDVTVPEGETWVFNVGVDIRVQ